LKDELGVKYVLNTASETFYQDLALAIKETGANLLLEYMGGEVPVKIFELMPEDSEMLIIGNLSL